MGAQLPQLTEDPGQVRRGHLLTQRARVLKGDSMRMSEVWAKRQEEEQDAAVTDGPGNP